MLLPSLVFGQHWTYRQLRRSLKGQFHRSTSVLGRRSGVPGSARPGLSTRGSSRGRWALAEAGEPQRAAEQDVVLGDRHLIELESAYGLTEQDHAGDYGGRPIGM